MLIFRPIPPLTVPTTPPLLRYYADLFGDHYTDTGFTQFFYGNDRTNIFHGDGFGDVMYGRGGNDLLFGHGGVDILNGDDGDDYLSGGADGDFLNGGDGDDRSYGGAGNDRINPGDGEDDAYGGSGDDTFIAGRGDQYYNGGSGSDWVSYENASSGIGISLSHGSAWRGEARRDTFVSIENVIGTDHDDDIRGTNGNNKLVGGAGADQIRGYAGDDQITGGANSALAGDRLFGGLGNDFFYFYEGDSGGAASLWADRILDFEGAVSPMILSDALFFEVNDTDYAADNWLATDYREGSSFELAGTVITIRDRDDAGTVVQSYQVILEDIAKEDVADWQINFLIN